MLFDNIFLKNSLIRSSLETEKNNYYLNVNHEFLDFKNIEATKIDQTKPWQPALELKLLKADGTTVNNLEANIPFFTLRNNNGNEIIINGATIYHINYLHFKQNEAGSTFNYPRIINLFEDLAKKLAVEIADNLKANSLSIEMDKIIGKEAVASINELINEKVLTVSDKNIVDYYRDEVRKLNKEATKDEKNDFIAKFKSANSSCKIQFGLIRDSVLIPMVKASKRDTNKLFIALGPNINGKKLVYTMAPGRSMPIYPDANKHQDEHGLFNKQTFNESAKAWFDNVMIIED